MPTEADTCRTYIVPKLHASTWENEYIAEQMVLTCGRILPIGDRQAKVNALWGLQVKDGEGLRRSRPLVLSVLDRAFKGEL